MAVNEPARKRDSSGGSDDRIAGFEVIFRSEHELVLMKPSGVASELTTDRKRVSLISRVREAGYPHARLPHRLDRMTRGFMLIALSKRSAAHHSSQIQEGCWRKFYMARIVSPSNPEALLGQQKSYLKRRRDQMSVVQSGGQPSFLDVLGVRPVPGRKGQSHVAIQLLTGRYHQIRVMLAHRGSPLIGDPLYDGPAGEPYLEHVALSFLPMGAEEPVCLFRRSDPGREPVDVALLDAVEEALQRKEDGE